MINPQFTNNEIYHLYNRGVDKRKIFMDTSDPFRFIHNLFEFNDQNPAVFFRSSNNRNKKEKFDIGYRTIEKTPHTQPRKLLVEILVWCLMPNHYHLLVRQLVDGGISLFIKKLGIGYTNSFNKKYDRSGVLFQGKFKAVRLTSDAHFTHLPFYIHLNPIDLIEPNWKQEGIKDYKKAIKFLEAYRFSSHMDCIGKKNFPSVSQRKWLLDVLGGQAEYKKQCYQWLKSMQSINEKSVPANKATAKIEQIEEKMQILQNLAIEKI